MCLTPQLSLDEPPHQEGEEQDHRNNQGHKGADDVGDKRGLDVGSCGTENRDWSAHHCMVSAGRKWHREPFREVVDCAGTLLFYPSCGCPVAPAWLAWWPAAASCRGAAVQETKPLVRVLNTSNPTAFSTCIQAQPQVGYSCPGPSIRKSGGGSSGDRQRGAPPRGGGTQLLGDRHPGGQREGAQRRYNLRRWKGGPSSTTWPAPLDATTATGPIAPAAAS